MKKCMAYRALACHGRQEFSGSRWVPCGLGVADGFDFCNKHVDAVIGGVLGLWVADLPAKAGLLEPDPACRTGRAVKDLKIRGNASQKKQGSIRRKLPPAETQL